MMTMFLTLPHTLLSATPPVETGATNWEKWVAISTLILAVVTFCVVLATLWLARRTHQLAEHAESEAAAVRQQAEATEAHAAIAGKQLDLVREQADAARLTAEAAQATVDGYTKPVLVDVPREYASGIEDLGRMNATHVSVQEQDDVLYCGVPLRNVGAGLAIVTGTALRVGSAPDWTGVPSRSMIPPGEETWARFTLARSDSQGAEIATTLLQRRDFSVEVRYSDAL